MGGNALGATRPRLSRQAYNDVVTELRILLVPKLYGCVEQPRSFASKTSFGDVDLLATLPCNPLDPVNDVGSTASSVNGNILSFEFRGFQIDIIQVSEELMELAHFFYGYGDTGMIFGMFTRNIGLKFGMQGLTLKCETCKIKLSQDLNAILQFLGLNYDYWRQGFQTQEEMFRFIQSSKYFRPSFFSRQNPEVLELDALKRTKGSKVFESPTIWNHEARHRLAERPMFSAWIHYVEGLPLNQDRIDADQVKAAALDAFSKQDELHTIEEHLALTRRVKAKFNGALAMKWTDYQVKGRNLGALMESFSACYTKAKIDQMADVQVQDAFVDFYQAHM